MATGNAYRSALDAGYRESTAKAKSFEFARAVRIPIADALRARGIDEVSQAQKLAQLQAARCVKFNPELGEFEDFDDGDVQMRATQEINRLLDAYPAPKQPDVSVPVQIVFPKSFRAIAGASRVQSGAGSDGDRGARPAETVQA